jgi:cardiolipin synthase
MPPTAEPHRSLPPPASLAGQPAPAGQPVLTGGNRVRLLAGGDEQFPAMCAAIAQARRQVWLATYIFHDDEAARQVALALADAARRGLWVGVVVDGFGSKATLPRLREWLQPAGVQLVVFRPVDRWWRLLQPGQLRRLHQKLCVVDGHTGFVGGINVIDDRNDLNHGWSEAPRLDFAVQVQGPLAAAIEQTARAIWSRAALGADWREELMTLARSAEPVARARRMVNRLRILPPVTEGRRCWLRRLGRPRIDQLAAELPPVRAAFVVRDNLRQRRAIEHAYIEAIERAERRVDVVCPYFYPGRVFRNALERAAGRGVRVRLLQGKADYRFAALAAQVLYGELLHAGVRIYEYTPAFLHAKVAVVDDDWATVGSSNIDPLSLLLNLEANVIVRDQPFAGDLALRFEAAVQASEEVTQEPLGTGWWGVLRRGFVAWTSYWFLRLAGWNGKY